MSPCHVAIANSNYIAAAIAAAGGGLTSRGSIRTSHLLDIISCVEGDTQLLCAFVVPS